MIYILGIITGVLLVIALLVIEMRFLRKDTTVTDKVFKVANKYVPKEKGLIITPLQGFNKAYKEKVLDATKDIKLDDLMGEDDLV